MLYALLIYTDEALDPKPGSEEFPAFFGGYKTFTEDVTSKGINKGGEALEPVATATTVRVRDGKTTTTDGPFAETKEQLGGFYLLDCQNLDEAVGHAAKIPSARHGSIEVRPVMVFDNM